MIDTDNHIFKLLDDLRIIDKNRLIKYSDRVRDREDIHAVKCESSGVIFLNKSAHSFDYYESKSDTPYWNESNYKRAKYFNYRDDLRRANRIRELVVNKKYCDFGTGAGGILSLISEVANETVGVELQETARSFVESEGFVCKKDIKEFDQKFDLITLFHVLEHLSDPINILSDIKSKMSDKGKIIIEVPHANDILLNLYQSENFKNFTLWSEHLILHTRVSLRKFLEVSGYKNIVIEGFQRYPLSNHLHWLVKGKPGGHEQWDFLNQDGVVDEYNKLLSGLNMTDTLIATANC